MAQELDLDEWIICIGNVKDFTALKDHKRNFKTNLACRLSNPTKSELGKNK